MRDVPLKDAVIAANRATKDRSADVRVFRRHDRAIMGHEFTTGAGEDRWDNHPSHRLAILHETLWFLAHALGIPTDVIHAAMQVIPEYRDLEGNDLAA